MYLFAVKAQASAYPSKKLICLFIFNKLHAISRGGKMGFLDCLDKGISKYMQ
jgi:hypothetical protein